MLREVSGGGLEPAVAWCHEQATCATGQVKVGEGLPVATPSHGLTRGDVPTWEQAFDLGAVASSPVRTENHRAHSVQGRRAVIAIVGVTRSIRHVWVAVLPFPARLRNVIVKVCALGAIADHRWPSSCADALRSGQTVLAPANPLEK
jgi:hypothetical protein